jgi:hypothetical protein
MLHPKPQLRKHANELRSLCLEKGTSSSSRDGYENLMFAGLIDSNQTSVRDAEALCPS